MIDKQWIGETKEAYELPLHDGQESCVHKWQWFSEGEVCDDCDVSRERFDMARAMAVIEEQSAKIEEYREALRHHRVSLKTHGGVCWCAPPMPEDMDGQDQWYKDYLWQPGEPEKHTPDADGKPCLAAPKPQPGR